MRAKSIFTLAPVAVLAFQMVDAAPTIQVVEGAFKEGQILTISGKGFTDKENEKPLFWWKADMGKTPSTLGRRTQWDENKFNGEITTDFTAPNAQRSARFDHGASSGAALGSVKFDSKKVFLFRKIYEDFDIVENVAIRAKVQGVDGTFKVGQLVTGQESGATGIVQSASIENGTGSIFFEKSGGTINEQGGKEFKFGERMVSSTATGINAEGSLKYPTGTFRTFNYKTLRFWNNQYKNNIHLNSQGSISRSFKATAEHTDATLWSGDIVDTLKQIPRNWHHLNVYYQASDIDVRDGIWRVDIDNIPSWDRKFITKSAERPGDYDVVYQSQVSNGAQPNSYVYYDSLYIDDSWHHVSVCSSAVWNGCKDKEVQIPLSWSDNLIEVQVNEGSLNLSGHLYLYFVDSAGVPNTSGYPLITKNPPVPPVLRVSEN